MSSVESLQKKIPLNNQIGLIGLLLCAFSSPLIMPLNIIAISEKFITFSSDNKKTESEFCDKKFPIETNINRAVLVYRYPFSFALI